MITCARCKQEIPDATEKQLIFLKRYGTVLYEPICINCSEKEDEFIDMD